MNVLFCRCRQCKHQKGKSGAKHQITSAKRKARRKCKTLLRLGNYDSLPVRVYAGYLS